MTIRNWIRLFFSTLFVGGVTAGIIGFIVRWNEFAPLFKNGEIGQIFSVLVWLIGIGFTFSVISQMGFFAYLTIHQFGLRMFRSLWNPVQLLVIALVIFDLVYFRFQAFAKNGESILPYILLAVLIIVVAIATSWIKSKQTNKNTFISAMFFMIVVTVLEWLPVLTVNEKSWLYLMLFPLLACNAYQILVLPKYNQLSQEQMEKKRNAVSK
ncbi:KinB-signaling pathway activation protein [Falsibacillus pallidus]|uniref:KinB signaling pathway activation protein n=1 Tax=Falsibacillus pallidus TaxID=493781 RepID=A0A370G582_9BACI|nr:KinB-signaling pathway activation protein [Falsibacillus pallidus]RDI38968.1 KinB signaling pathway activation protein [Falsibacillus pallidus]